MRLPDSPPLDKTQTDIRAERPLPAGFIPAAEKPCASRDRQRRWWRRVLLTTSAAAPVAVFASGLQPAVMAGALAIHGLLAYALFRGNCGWLGPVVSTFVTARKEVWLTIDDGPDGSNTLRLAELLESRGVRATFFFRGENVSRQPEIPRGVMDRGHTVANHSHTHRFAWFWCLPPAQVAKELDLCQDALAKSGAGPGNGFRAPAGIKSIFLHPALDRRGLRLIGWTVRGLDGFVCNPARTIARVRMRVRPGAIILLHEGKLDRAGIPQSHECVVGVVDELLAMGYSFVIPGNDQLVD